MLSAWRIFIEPPLAPSAVEILASISLRSLKLPLARKKLPAVTSTSPPPVASINVISISLLEFRVTFPAAVGLNVEPEVELVAIAPASILPAAISTKPPLVVTLPRVTSELALILALLKGWLEPKAPSILIFPPVITRL